ncbi:MAG: hypothetical protein EPN72_01070 [Nevskiaceae bacterium]|nr:MAG: hypothetical protein EPN63_11820 [Nevskiaceae bacterium]TBR74648.1 MAG: hypothetical protein EPN72_01070 [Nevskiaceae bacterium]
MNDYRRFVGLEYPRLIAAHRYKVTNPREGDVILLRSAPWHVGVVAYPPNMLPCLETRTSCIESWLSRHWCSRVVGFYRYRDVSEL